MKNIKTTIKVGDYDRELDASIMLENYDATNTASELHVWLNDADIIALTEDNNYRNITEQMGLVSAAVVPAVAHLLRDAYGSCITCECFGVADGRMYILFFFEYHM